MTKTTCAVCIIHHGVWVDYIARFFALDSVLIFEFWVNNEFAVGDLVPACSFDID